MVTDMFVKTWFWITIVDCLKESEPLLVVLRLVDGDTKPTLASLIEG